jgi:hypothetical protein
MKTVILAVLLLLAVASIVSSNTTGAPVDPEGSTVTGKSRYEHETSLPVILQTLQLYNIVSLLNYELRYYVWRNAGKSPRILFPAREAKAQVA